MHSWVNVVWSPGLIGPGPSELLSPLADLDCNWRCGGGMNVRLLPLAVREGGVAQVWVGAGVSEESELGLVYADAVQFWWKRAVS